MAKTSTPRRVSRGAIQSCNARQGVDGFEPCTGTAVADGVASSAYTHTKGPLLIYLGFASDQHVGSVKIICPDGEFNTGSMASRRRFARPTIGSTSDPVTDFS
jgi:hypothetical protein